MKSKFTKEEDALVAAVVQAIPGSRRLGSSGVLALPVRGMTAQLRPGGGTILSVSLRVAGREIARSNVPGRALAGVVGSTARTVSALVLDACGKAPRQRQTADGETLEQRVGCWVSAAGLEAATANAEARGMSVAGLLRRGLALAMQEPLDEDEAAVRGALRLVLASGAVPKAEAVALTATAEAGSRVEVAKALRTLLRESPVAKDAARLLGVGWMFEDD